jgi:hypothetical protein
LDLVQRLLRLILVSAGRQTASPCRVAFPVVTTCGFLGGGLQMPAIVPAAFLAAPCAKRGRSGKDNAQLRLTAAYLRDQAAASGSER